MSRNGKKTKSRDGSSPIRVKGTSGKERRDLSIGNSRGEFGNMNINFVKILNKGCEAIGEYFKMIGIRRVETEYSILGCGG